MKLSEGVPGIEFMPFMLLGACDSVSVSKLLFTRAMQSQANPAIPRRRVGGKRRKRRRSPRRRRTRARRRKKGGQHLFCKQPQSQIYKCSKARCLSECTIGGSSSSATSGDEDSSSCLESEDVDDSAALFGLSRKELQKNDEMCKLDDFPSKQLGFVLSHVSEMLGATEVYECGGELEPGTHYGFAWGANTSTALMK